MNFDALIHGLRTLSAYPIDPAKPSKGYGENCFCIIAEADRSATSSFCPLNIDDKESGRAC
ncbi:hypothetical protein SAMN05414139_10826 [Burkholderia sp. D7]|nr:hypothetical protein SAMN05414139_10826 [Burkholderia sp. D7]